jgi:hypothetical protein
MQGFAKKAFDCFWINRFCCEKRYVIAVLGKGVGDGYCDKFASAVIVQSWAEDADIFCND